MAQTITHSKLALIALGIFQLWYVLHELWLLPDGHLDYWVALRVFDGAAFVTKLFGFASIIILYFFVVRPIRVGFISMLLDYMEPALSVLKGVVFSNSETTLILTNGNQEATV